MMIPGFPTLVSAPGFAAPLVSLTADSSGPYSGYVRSGGYFSGLVGYSGGSLTATILPGFVTDTVVDFDGDFQSILIGDATGALEGMTAIEVDGVPYLLSAPPSYNSGGDFTGLAFAPIGGFEEDETYTIQLV